MQKKSTRDILQAPRGMRDFYGREFEERQNFFLKAQKVAKHFGFSGIETPILEHTEIFLKGVGEGTDIVEKEMYNLETSGGDRLTLRPEGTAAVMRAYIEHGMGSLPQPLMLYYYGPFFRHEKPQKGRYRQLYQFGLEIMGSKNPLHDALIIQTGYEILKKTSKKITVSINSIGNNAERNSYTELLREYYQKHREELAESDRKRIETNPLRILDSKEEATKEVNKNAPELQKNLGRESSHYFERVLESLDDLGIPYEIVPSLVRGLDYYEHTVFEYVTLDEHGKKSHALGGGGRYDGLAETMGHNRAIPSVGLGLGVDRILEIAHSEAFSRREKKKKFFFISLGESAHREALKIATRIEDEIPLFLNLSDAKLSKQLEKAEKQNYDFALILGEREQENSEIRLKNLQTREEKRIPLENISEVVKKHAC